MLEAKLAGRSSRRAGDPKASDDLGAVFRGRRGGESDLKRAADPDRDRIINTFRNRPTPEDRLERRATSRHRVRPRRRGRVGHGHGHHHLVRGHHGHGHGHHRFGVHFGHGHHFVGHHFGGFGFHRGHWHFTLVVGVPVYWYPYYNYSYSRGYYDGWWDGRVTSLSDWDASRVQYGARFDMAESRCVELRLRTRDGVEYQIKVDPRYWDARDPGDLYAALWAELEEFGRLELEDLGGRVYVFSSGQLQEIEAAACY